MVGSQMEKVTWGSGDTAFESIGITHGNMSNNTMVYLFRSDGAECIRFADIR
jgi:hypothetical protein